MFLAVTDSTAHRVDAGDTILYRPASGDDLTYLVIAPGSISGVAIGQDISGGTANVTGKLIQIAPSTGGGGGGFNISSVDADGLELLITAANTAANPLSTRAYTDEQIGDLIIPTVVDVVADGNTNAVSSNAVFDTIGSLVIPTVVDVIADGNDNAVSSNAVFDRFGDVAFNHRQVVIDSSSETLLQSFRLGDYVSNIGATTTVNGFEFVRDVTYQRVSVDPNQNFSGEFLERDLIPSIVVTDGDNNTITGDAVFDAVATETSNRTSAIAALNISNIQDIDENFRGDLTISYFDSTPDLIVHIDRVRFAGTTGTLPVSSFTGGVIPNETMIVQTSGSVHTLFITAADIFVDIDLAALAAGTVANVFQIGSPSSDSFTAADAQMALDISNDETTLTYTDRDGVIQSYTLLRVFRPNGNWK